MCPGRQNPNRPSFSKVGRRSGESCRFAGATTQPSGIPEPSVSSDRFVPCLPRSTGDFPATSPPQGALTMHPGGTGVWSFIEITDAATATVAAVDRGAPGVYNVVDDDPAPLAEWLPYLAKVA